MTTKEFWKCTDGTQSDDYNMALQHEKAINVRARFRGVVPKKFLRYTAADGTTFEGQEHDSQVYYKAHGYEADLQAKVRTQIAVEGLVSLLWRENMTREQFAALVAKQMPRIEDLIGRPVLAGQGSFQPAVFPMVAQG